MVWEVFASLMNVASERNKKLNFFADPILIKINCNRKLFLNKITYFHDYKIYDVDYREKNICYGCLRL